jgi:4-hydroxybenzoate polyprenyltransferase
VLEKALLFVDSVRFQETVFALPFAYTGMVLAAHAAGRLPTWHELAWITVAMVGARTFGMSANRVVDRRLDALNPRTADRHLATGRLRVVDVAAPALVSLAVLALSAAMLNPLAFALAPVAAAYLALYPYSKRFTWAANLLLGWALAIAPSAAWIGVTGGLAWQPVLLSAAVAFWAGSFDIVYHVQDVGFYRERGLHSVASRFGIDGAFRWALLLDVAAIVSLLALGVWMELAWVYYLGPAAAVGLLVYKRRLVSPDDTSRIGMTFFRINAYLSTSVFLATLAAVLI